jgi:hypothetical protein
VLVAWKEPQRFLCLRWRLDLILSTLSISFGIGSFEGCLVVFIHFADEFSNFLVF